MRALVYAAALATMLAGPAFAQTGGSSPTAGSGANSVSGNSGVRTGSGSGVVSAAPPQPVGGTNAIGANTAGINSPAGAGGNSPR